MSRVLGVGLRLGVVVAGLGRVQMQGGTHADGIRGAAVEGSLVATKSCWGRPGVGVVRSRDLNPQPI